jgi:hypothetical protein
LKQVYLISGHFLATYLEENEVLKERRKGEGGTERGKKTKQKQQGQVWWHASVIPAMRKAEVEGVRSKKCKTLSKKQLKCLTARHSILQDHH